MASAVLQWWMRIQGGGYSGSPVVPPDVPANALIDSNTLDYLIDSDTLDYLVES